MTHGASADVGRN